MNREIKYKFRLKMLHEKWGMYSKGDIDVFTIDLLSLIRFPIEKRWEVVSCDEYTGLKDKNGKEIYEGDIIKKDYGSGNPIAPIAYHVERAAYIFNDGKYNELLFNIGRPYIVIGNIYENPELIN